MTRNWIALAAVVLMASVLQAAGLDGTRWKVKLMPDKATQALGEKAFNDTLEFKDGKMTSSACVPFGFGSSEYKFSETAGVTAFMTMQTSEKAGSSRWDGVTEGKKEIKGAMVMTQKDGKTKTYLFQGSKATAAKSDTPKKAS